MLNQKIVLCSQTYFFFAKETKNIHEKIKKEEAPF